MGRFLLVFSFRLLLLLVGGSLAALAGTAIAIKYPDSTAGKPLIANVLPLGNVQLANRTPTTEPTAASEAATPTEPQTQLTAEEKQKLETELKQLQKKLKRLQNRRGKGDAIAKLEAQIQQVEQQLQSPGAEVTSELVASSTPFIASDTRMATIPSDALFLDNQSILRSEAAPILDKLAQELKNYPKATVRISGHTDAVGDAKNNRILSFRQAQALEQYLSSELGKDYRWLVVGYGEAFPLASNDNPVSLQRNRRIEIAIQ